MEDWRWPYGLLMSPAPPPPANEELLIMLLILLLILVLVLILCKRELEGFRLLRKAFGLDFSLAPQHGKFPILYFGRDWFCCFCFSCW